MSAKPQATTALVIVGFDGFTLSDCARLRSRNSSAKSYTLSRAVRCHLPITASCDRTSCPSAFSSGSIASLAARLAKSISSSP